MTRQGSRDRLPGTDSPAREAGPPGAAQGNPLAVPPNSGLLPDGALDGLPVESGRGEHPGRWTGLEIQETEQQVAWLHPWAPQSFRSLASQHQDFSGVGAVWQVRCALARGGSGQYREKTASHHRAVNPSLLEQPAHLAVGPDQSEQQMGGVNLPVPQPRGLASGHLEHSAHARSDFVGRHRAPFTPPVAANS